MRMSGLRSTEKVCMLCKEKEPHFHSLIAKFIEVIEKNREDLPARHPDNAVVMIDDGFEKDAITAWNTRHEK